MDEGGCGFVPPHNWPFEAKRSNWPDSGGGAPARPQLLGVSESWRVGRKECGILEGLTPPSESERVNAMRSHREQEQRNKRPHLQDHMAREGGQGVGPVWGRPWGTCLRRALPQAALSQLHHRPGSWELQAFRKQTCREFRGLRVVPTVLASWPEAAARARPTSGPLGHQPRRRTPDSSTTVQSSSYKKQIAIIPQMSPCQ